MEIGPPTERMIPWRTVKEIIRATVLTAVGVIGFYVVATGLMNLQNLSDTGDYSVVNTPNPTWTIAVILSALGIVLLAIAGFGLSYRTRK